MAHPLIFRAAIALVLAAGTWAAHAGPASYVATPGVEEGEREIDFKWGAQRNRDGSTEAAHSIGLGYGVNAWWFTELYLKYKREAGSSNAFDAWEWENRFALTEPGKYPVDLGLLLEIERPQDRTEGYEVTWGPLLQSEWGRVQANANLLFQRHWRAAAAYPVELHYQAQLKYRQAEQFEWGVQALGNLGAWDHWSTRSAQEHQAGPAAFGKVRVGPHQAVRWNAALLHGFTDASPRNTLRLQAEYEF